MDYNSNKNQDIKRKFVEQHVYSNINDMVEYILSQLDPEAPFTWEDVENLDIYPECNDFEGGTEKDRQEHIEYLEDTIDILSNDLDQDREEYEELKHKQNPTKADIERANNLEKYIENRENDLQNLEIQLNDIEDLIAEPQEIFQWFIVSEYLSNKLLEKGEVVIPHENIWGRGCCGQAILLDSVISEICHDMEILEGQKYEWSI